MKTVHCGMVVVLATLWLADVVSAQTEQTPEVILDEPVAVEEEAPAAQEEDTDSREVDYNEENFRRSMELRDRELDRSRGLSDTSPSGQSGIQALEGLPEESQKHLREQLREVIMEKGPWTPEEAGEVYPYVPSAAAEKNGSLKQKEEAAWGELVTKYHEREAEIHMNSSRTAAATGNPAGAESPQDQMGEETGQASESGQDNNAAENAERQAENRADQRAERQAALESLLNSNASTTSSGQAQPPSTATEGVSQNALQLLQQRQQVPEGSPAASESASAASDTAQQMAQNSQSAQNSSAESSNTEGASAASGEIDRAIELDLESEGVIAIRELEKIELEDRDK